MMNQQTNAQTDPLFESELCADQKVSPTNLNETDIEFKLKNCIIV